MISKEAKKKYDKEYRLRKKEYFKEYSKKYYKENKEAILKRIKKYRKDNPDAEDKEKRKLRSKRYREKNPLKSRMSVWKKRKISITIGGYEEIYKKQQGKCAICEVHELEFKNKLCLDHNHKNGHPRGLLCRKCNSVLGMIERGLGGKFRDPLPLLKNAVLYIEENSRKKQFESDCQCGIIGQW